VKSSWADEVEEVDHSELPPPTITWDKDIKTITEYKRNEEGKKVKVRFALVHIPHFTEISQL
jgi:hypothetical protein